MNAIDSILQQGSEVRKAYRQTNEENQISINAQLIRDLELDQAGLRSCLTATYEDQIQTAQKNLSTFKATCDTKRYRNDEGRGDPYYHSPRTWCQCLSSSIVHGALIFCPCVAPIWCYRTIKNKAEIKRLEQEVENYKHNSRTSVNTGVEERHEEICIAISDLLQEDSVKKRNALAILNYLKPEEKQWIESHVSEIMNDLGIVTM